MPYRIAGAGTRRHLKRNVAVVGATAAAAAALLAGPAGAAVIPPNAVLNEPPAGSVSILAFPQRDFVSTAGFDAADVVTVNVIRNGVAIGSATDQVPQDDPKTAGFDGLVDVNHPGGGCWEVNTPDILPGDQIRTTVTAGPDLGKADQTFVQDVTAGPIAETAPGSHILVVHGTAKDALTGDHRYPAGELESRLVNNTGFLSSKNRRTMRAVLDTPGNDGTLSYDNPADPANFNWTATFDLSKVAEPARSADIASALSADTESRGMWLGRNPAALTENTIYENGQVNGPTAPCTAPAAATAITSTSRAFVNAAYVASPSSLPVTVSGLAENGPAGVTGVSVAFPGGKTYPATFTPGAPSATAGVPSRTWSASIPAADLAAQPDGDITLTATYTPAVRAPDTVTIKKDTVLPPAPLISPGSGFFPATQTVSLLGEPGATLHVTTSAAGSAVTPASPAYSAPFAVSSTSTVNALAVDAAGNPGPVASSTLTIDRTAPTTQITSATAGDGTPLPFSTASTSATFTFAADEPTSKIECQLDAGNWVPCTSPQSYTGLGEGAHRFIVRSTDRAGNLDASPPARGWTVTKAAAAQPQPQPVPPTIIQQLIGGAPAPAAQPAARQPASTPAPGARPAANGTQPAANGTALPVRATLKITALKAPRSIKLAKARKGVKVTMVLPRGTTRLTGTLSRSGKTVKKIALAHKAGAARLILKVTRRGSYKLTLKATGSAAGAATTLSFRVT